MTDFLKLDDRLFVGFEAHHSIALVLFLHGKTTVAVCLETESERPTLSMHEMFDAKSKEKARDFGRQSDMC